MRNVCKFAISGAIISLILSPSSGAFEIGTHAAMTFEAYGRTQLAQPNSTIFQKLGLIELDKLQAQNPFGEFFFDFVGGVIHERRADSQGFPPFGYESQLFDRVALGAYFLTIPGWAMRGALREDDVYWDPRAELNNPQDDLCTQNSQPCYRVLNHFFDPYNVRSIVVTVPEVGGVRLPLTLAPNWAIGTSDAFADNVTENVVRSNHFSVFDAREAMFRAITLQKTNPFGPGYVEIFSGGSGTDADRSAAQQGYWATTFRALGSVVHLIQDMAQPQHTRSEPHIGNDYDSKGIAGHKSFYEAYIETRALGVDFVAKGLPGRKALPLAYSGYPVPLFNSYTDYWSTARGVAARTASLTGTGLADYSSRGFYTVGTNIGSQAGAAYPQPTQQSSAATFESVDNPLDMADQPLQGTIQFVVGNVIDTANPGLSQPAVRLSAYGLFDQFLRESGKPEAFTLNVHNYDAQAELLVPRAVAYSTGLIDYFFRGELKVSLPDEGIYSIADYSTGSQSNSGFKKIKARIRNVTPAITPPAESTSYRQRTSNAGKLVAVLRYRINRCLTWPTLQNSPKRNPVPGEPLIWDEDCRTPAIRVRNSENAQPVQVLPKITVSNYVDAPAGLDDDDQLVTFTFPNALPFNAIDVDLQVVYRGPLGTELDGIAVGFEYLSEPSFVNFDNFDDCTQPCEGCTHSYAIQLPFGPGTRQDAKVDNMPAGSYARVAFLAYAGARREVTSGVFEYAPNNQDYPYDVKILDYSQTPPALLETWAAGTKITGGLFESREIEDLGRMMSWRSITGSGATCETADCFAGVASCPRKIPSANKFPVPVTIVF